MGGALSLDAIPSPSPCSPVDATFAAKVAQGCSAPFGYQRTTAQSITYRRGMLADEINLWRTSRTDAVVASMPTLAYAIGAIGGLRIAAYAGIATALIVCAVAARRSPMAAVSGLLAVLFAVGLAVITGRPKAFFLPGIALNGALAAAGVASLLARVPALGFALAAVWPRFAGWRSDAGLRRVAAALTAIWSSVFLLRFVVMGGCYLADADPSVLAVVKIVLGLPIAALAAAMSLRLVTAQTALNPATD